MMNRQAVLKLLLAALLAESPIAGAALIPIDLIAPGDALLTRDTATGLDWSDLTVTNGMAYLSVASGAGGWLQLGFQFANVDQVATLFEHAGIFQLNAALPENLPVQPC